MTTTAWQSALRKQLPNVAQAVADRLSVGNFSRPVFRVKDVDHTRLVSIDFETYYDNEYTLRKLSTSEYVRDPRFKAQMMYLKVGNKAPRIIPAAKIAAELRKINWGTHALLCHHTQFDGLILSHHYGVVPCFYYDTLSMARGLHSNEIGAGLDEVSAYYGGAGKLDGILEKTKGVRDWSPALFKEVTPYCLNDGDEMLRVFNKMIWSLPIEEIDLIDLIVRMFCEPLLKLNLPRIEAELARELAEREALLRSIINVDEYHDAGLVKSKEKLLPQTEQDMIIIKRMIGSNDRFAELLKAEDVDPPVKISPAWMKRSFDEREATLDDKWSYAFAKDDIEFANLPDDQARWTVKYDLDDPGQVKLLTEKSERLRALVDARIAVKSTTNITRAERFLTSGANGMRLPVYYAYSRAHTHRLGGGDKRNPQNLKRGGELRQSILAPDGHVLVVCDSGQIEPRLNSWLWGQDDMLASFRAADTDTGADPYCVMATAIYGRAITKADKDERFVGKVLVISLGYQTGATKLQLTMAKGALGGPPVFISLQEAQRWVNTYRTKNHKIVTGWKVCGEIIENMATGREGKHGPISWEKDCIWLPNGMKLHYPGLKKAAGDKGWDEWTYSSTLKGQPVRKKIYGGLLCLGANTQVLTDNGWKSLIEVRLSDKLWDGTNWVEHSGVIYKGWKETIDFGGVRITPDHEVLVEETWVAAGNTSHDAATSSCERHYGTATRSACGGLALRKRWQEDVVEAAMRLRNSDSSFSDRIPEGQFQELRVRDQRDAGSVHVNPQDVSPSGLQRMAQHAGPLPTPNPSVLGSLRRAWHNSLRRMGEVRDVLVRHAVRVCSGLVFGPAQQQPWVLSGQLSVGHAQDKQSEHPCTSTHFNPDRADTPLASERAVRNWKHDSLVSTQRRVASSTNVRQTEHVFDLSDAGPLHRFTVRGDDGQPFIVHNCENIVQALARIIVMYQMLDLSRSMRMVMTTHDEMVACVKKRSANAAFSRMMTRMTRPLDWCPDIPLSAEGGWAENYSK